MPVRIGPEPDPKRASRRRERRRGALLWLALLGVVALGATALALPDVANRLALPWAPNKPLAPEPSPIAAQRALVGPDGKERAPTKNGVAKVLERATGDPALGSLTGSVVDPATGTVLWEQGSDKPLTPASTSKLLTAAAALLAVDHPSTLTTEVVAGDTPGEVVLVAGGDPTLNSLPGEKDSVYPGAARLDDLVERVRKATGGKVDTVRLDLGAYSGGARAKGWSPEDAPSTYAAPVEAAMLDGGREDPTSGDSRRTGDPAGALARALAERLDARVGAPATAKQGAKVLGKVHSPPLTELIDTMLLSSDNVLAEAVARRTAIEVGAEPSFDGAAKATLDVLRENGFDLDGVRLSDGSGLSVRNRIPARLLTELLAAAAAPDRSDPRTAKLRPLLGGLPVAGGSGTLADRYEGTKADDGKGWVRAKTGTLSEVNTLAGMVLDTDGRVLVFALMSSGTPANSARPALDVVAAALRGCGCR